jgi:hypothetical protein
MKNEKEKKIVQNEDFLLLKLACLILNGFEKKRGFLCKVMLFKGN